MNLNKAILAGNLTRDPELKYLPNGTAVCQIGIATNRRWKDASGQDKEEVYFGDCVAWGKQAEVIGQYFKKGQPIYVEGRLKREEWENKQGVKQSATRITIESFQFVGGKKEDASPQKPKPKITAADVPELPPGVAEQFKDDVPF